MMSSLLLDLRFAWRLGVRQPVLSLAALFTLAIGFGATTALYSAAHAWLIAPLPFSAPDRLVAVWETIPSAVIAGLLTDPRYVGRDRSEHSSTCRTAALARPYEVV